MGYETDSIRNKNLALTTELGQVRAECQALRNEMAMMKQSMARVRSKSAAEIRKARQQRKTRVVVREVKVPGPVRIVQKTVEKRVRGPGALSVANYKQETQIVTNGGLTYTVGQGVLRIKPEIIGV